MILRWIMQTKYGTLSDNEISLYCKKLINQMYKLMPMREDDEPTYDAYLIKLIQQLHGANSLIVEDSLFISIVFNLESLFSIDDIKLHNSMIKENLSMCQKLIVKFENYERGDDSGI